MWPASEDPQLIKKALAGSERAWLTLVRRHERMVYNLAWRMTGRRQDALDLMQESFLAAFRNLPNFRADGPFPAWLRRIVSHRCIDFLRRRQSNPLHDSAAWEAHEQHGESLEHEAEQQQRHDAVLALMQHLPPEQRLVVELKFFQDLTFEAIASEIGIPANTAKTRLYSALKNLRSAKELQHVL